MLNALYAEKFLILAALTAVVALPLEHQILALGQAGALLVAALIVAVIMITAVRLAHHAEMLAERFGDPYGTMILTISAVLVEVVILVIMLSHTPSATLVRDTIYSAVMIDMNGIIGMAALIGGLKYGEQKYNVDTGNSYIVIILTAMAISMVVPEFVPHDRDFAYSVFTIFIMLVLYSLFLKLQTGQHSYFFSYSYRRQNVAPSAEETARLQAAEASQEEPAPLRNSMLLILGLILIGVLSEVMSPALDLGIRGTAIPPILPGILVALISASPEILTALRSALANRMQSTLNIALGASLSTVLLTVPVVEAIALFTGHPVTMAMTPVQTLMVFVTLMAAMINLHDGETNAIEGKSHFALFLTFVMLSAIGL